MKEEGSIVIELVDSGILLIEPPATSKFGNQRIWGGNGSNKSDFRKAPLDLLMISGYLRKKGYDNNFLDANNSRKDHEYYSTTTEDSNDYSKR